MFERIRALLVVVQEGSVNKAAVRLRISQPALSRQMSLLEEEVGGKLLERGPSGVSPTALAHVLLKSMEPVFAKYDAALAEARGVARGIRAELRIGYLISAASAIVSPALAQIRRLRPELKLQLLDMSPREQMEALKEGDLDLALTGQEGAVAARDFYSRTLASIGVCVAVADTDSLVSSGPVSLAQLKGRDFIGVDENEMPGRNQWIAGLCRRAGFRPKFVQVTDGITHILSQVASENAVTLVPNYFRDSTHPGVRFLDVGDAWARWDFVVLWQRGKVPEATRMMVEALSESAKAFSV
jgi:DNA-binding transcriptional LysR family regulator